MTTMKRKNHPASSSSPSHRIAPAASSLCWCCLLVVFFLLSSLPESCRADQDDPNDTTTATNSTCSDLLLRADADADGVLTETEYLGFLRLRFPGCAAYAAAAGVEALPAGQQIAFASACAVGAVFGGAGTSCDPPAWDLADPTAHGGYCAAAAGAALLDGCDVAVDAVVDDLAPDPVPTPAPLGDDCIAALVAADANQNGALDEGEYLQYARTAIYDSEEEYAGCAPGETQLATFSALACAACLLDGTCDTCGAAIDISAATSEDGIDLFERASLVGICLAAQSTAALECAAVETPTNSLAPAPSPVDDLDFLDDDACIQALDASDADRNSFLDATEFAALVAELLTEEDCELPSDGLSPSHSSAFNAMACASCLVDPECGCGDESTARISIAGAAEGPDAFERIRLGAICASTRTASAVECSGAFGYSLAPFPSPPVLGERCIADLIDSDANQDGVLEEEEYLQFVQTFYDTIPEYSDCTPGDTQSSTFNALACATCLLDGTCDTCGASVNITAASSDSISFLERASLVAICVAAESAGTVECAFPTADLDPTADLGADDGDEGMCAQSLDAADADRNSYLDMNEYATLAADLTDDGCELPVGDNGSVLSPSHSAAFNSLACTSCLVDAECGCGGDMPRISIAGAAEGPTGFESIRLNAICASTRAASAVECNIGGEPSPTPAGTAQDGNSPTAAPATQAPVAASDNDGPTASPAIGPTPTASPATGPNPTTASGATTTPAPALSITNPVESSSGSPTTTTITGAVLLLAMGVQLLIG